MTKLNRYDTVVLREAVAGFEAGEVGAVVEVYTTPYEAYDVELVADDGTTKALLEALRPQQLEVPPTEHASPNGTALTPKQAANPTSR